EPAIRAVRSAAAFLALRRSTGWLSPVPDENAGAGGRCCAGTRCWAAGTRIEPRFSADTVLLRGELEWHIAGSLAV
ncbi:MAG TPA: hypothetical protein PK867_15835, partial [Pirellulales bacterium]|nr:hypothetical protein [Pirellulales bacterium]